MEGIEKFKDYYPIPQDEKSRVFSDVNTYFVFDTNALLDIYRVGQSLSSKIMKILKKYESKIVIPYHVAEEYHDNLLSVLVGFCNKYDSIANSLTLEVLLKGVTKEFELDKYPFIRDALKRNFGDGLKKMGVEMKKEHNFLHKQISSWNLQNSIASFLNGKIMDGFKQEDIEAIEKEGAERYKKLIPPGHEDKTKTTNQYGDLIIWKEILKFAEEHQNSSMVFVSRDLKEDWITHIHGKKWGPRVELLKEFHEKNPNTLLMYTLSEFVRYANTGTNILDDNDIQSVTKYTNISDSQSGSTAQDMTDNHKSNSLFSDTDIKNLLLLNMLRRNMGENMGRNEQFSKLKEQAPDSNNIDIDNNNDFDNEE